MIRAVVLAAGQGARLGGVAKALLVSDGMTFLARIAARLEEAAVAEPIVVLGPPHGESIRAEAERLGFSVAWNPEPARGMASSVSLGFAALGDRGDVALLWPVDTPGVGREAIGAVLGQADASGAVIPTFEDRGGHPVAVGRSLWPALVSCSAEKEGARSVFRHNRERIVRLPVSDPLVLRDIDTRSDLARFGAR